MVNMESVKLLDTTDESNYSVISREDFDKKLKHHHQTLKMYYFPKYGKNIQTQNDKKYFTISKCKYNGALKLRTKFLISTGPMKFLSLKKYFTMIFSSSSLLFKIKTRLTIGFKLQILYKNL